ncbi:MAG: HepT-like ribonuclease domain-containing protein [Bacteroidota bacterium]
MKQFRNIVAHDYFGVDAEEVWQIIKNNLPALAKEVKAILLKAK